MLSVGPFIGGCVTPGAVSIHGEDGKALCPSSLRPADSVAACIMVMVNGTPTPCSVYLEPSGCLKISAGVNGLFPGSGILAIPGFVLCWLA